MNENKINEPIISSVEKNIHPVISEAPVISVKDWMIIILITMIPVLNFIMYFVWAFSKTDNPSKTNWAKANLIWMAIWLVVIIIFMGAIISFFNAALN